MVRNAWWMVGPLCGQFAVRADPCCIANWGTVESFTAKCLSAQEYPVLGYQKVQHFWWYQLKGFISRCQLLRIKNLGRVLLQLDIITTNRLKMFRRYFFTHTEATEIKSSLPGEVERDIVQWDLKANFTTITHWSIIYGNKEKATCGMFRRVAVCIVAFILFSTVFVFVSKNVINKIKLKIVLTSFSHFTSNYRFVSSTVAKTGTCLFYRR